MPSNCRRTLATATAIAFLVWHGAAIVVGPYPDSDVSEKLRPMFESYLRIGYLDHAWTFFGPQPDAGRLVRYELILSGGTVREYPLSEAVDRSSPNWFRWMRLFDRVATGGRELQNGAAEHLCRRHADLEPRALRFVVLHQLTLSPDLHRAGVRPVDPEALSRAPGDEVPCGFTLAQRP